MPDSWTPGPWITEEPEWPYNINVLKADNTLHQIAVVDAAPEYIGADECVANALLIAAAPDLYAALLDFMALECTDLDDTEILLEVFNKGRAALAKARGET